MGELETNLLDVLLDITLEGSHEGRDAFVVVNLEREREREREEEGKRKLREEKE